MGGGAQVGGRLNVESGVLLHEPSELAAGVGSVGAVRLVDEHVEFGEALVLPFGDAMGPLGQSRLVRCMPFVPAEPNKDKRGRHPHVQSVPAPRRVADYSAHAKFSEVQPHFLGLRASFKPVGVPKLHRHSKFPRPFLQVGRHGGGMLGRKVGRKLDERGAEFVPEGQESIDEVVGRPVAVVEPAEVGDDLGKFGAKPKSLRHRCGPFRHAVGGVDAVVGGVEFQGPKLPSVMLRPRALGIFFRVHRTAPVSDGPHGSASPNRRRISFSGGNNIGQTKARRWHGVCPIQPPWSAIELAKLHASKIIPTPGQEVTAKPTSNGYQFRGKQQPECYSLPTYDVFVRKRGVPWMRRPFAPQCIGWILPTMQVGVARVQ